MSLCLASVVVSLIEAELLTPVSDGVEFSAELQPAAAAHIIKAAIMIVTVLFNIWIPPSMSRTALVSIQSRFSIYTVFLCL